MARPQWITDSGLINTLPELEFISIPLEVTNPENDTIEFTLTSGELPPGMQIKKTGALTGVPVILEPLEVDEIRGYKFTVRAKAVNANVVVDRSFTIRVTNSYPPYIIPRISNLGATFDGTYYSKQLNAIEYNPNANLKWRQVGGKMPEGLSISESGLISGYIKIVPGDLATVGTPGYDVTYDTGAWDSVGRSTNKQYSFTIEVTDGSNIDTLTYTLNVASKGSFTADQGELDNGQNISLTADNDLLTIDHDNRYVPIITTPPQSLPVVRQENYFAYKFDAIDFEGDNLTWQMQVAEGGSYDQGAVGIFGWGTTKPQIFVYFDTDNIDLVADVDIDITQYPENTQFYITGVKYIANDDQYAQSVYTDLEEGVDFTVDQNALQVTFTDLSVVPDNAYVAAVVAIDIPDNSLGGTTSGFDGALFDQSESKLPPVLNIDENGWLNGYVEPQAEDIKTYQFIVSAYKTDDPTYESNRVQFSLTILGSLTDFITWTTPTDLGTVIPGEVSQLSISATSARGQGITYSIALDSKTRIPQGLSFEVLENGYISGRTTFNGFTLDNKTTTFDKHTTFFDNTFEFTAIATTLDGLTKSRKRFTVRVNPRYTRPYENLYLKALPTQEQRQLFLDVVNNQEIFPDNLIYRKEDPYFGRAKTIKFLALAGINPAKLADYIAAIEHNHYTKTINFSNIKTARAVDEFYNVKYEVVYVEVEDPYNVNNALVPESIGLGEITSSFGSQFLLNQTTDTDYNPYLDAQGNEYDTVYPNTFENMNNRIISALGYSARGVYPDWMLSVQEDKTVIGFKRAVVLAYTVPGASKLIAYRLQNSGFGFSEINFTVDRYQLDNYLSQHFDIDNNKFYDAEETTFDRLVIGPGELQIPVTYAVRQSFDSIHLRTRAYINSNKNANPLAGAGIDGVTNFKHGDTLIFAQQEHFNDVGENDGWVKYQNTYVGDIPGDGSDAAMVTEGGIRIGNTLSGPKSIWNFTNGTVTLEANGLPYHSYGTNDSYDVAEAQNYVQRWPYRGGYNHSDPAHPKVPAGIMGYWINGVAMYNPTDGNTAPDGYDYIAGSEYISASSASLALGYTWHEDPAGGHANGNGRYHYHDFHFDTAWLTGIGNEAGTTETAEVDVIPYLDGSLVHADGHSKILGITLDGYPVYGPYGYVDPLDSNSGVRRIETSYSQYQDFSHRSGLINDPERYPLGMFVEDFYYDGHGDLDVHNGRWTKTPDYPNGTYAYFLTVDLTLTPVFPYIIGPTYYGHPALPGISDSTSGYGYEPAGTDLIDAPITGIDSIYGFDSYVTVPGFREKSLTVTSKLLVSTTEQGADFFDIEYMYGVDLVGRALIGDTGIPDNTKIIQQQTVDISTTPGVVNLVTRLQTNNPSEVKLYAGSTVRIINAMESVANGTGKTITVSSIPADLKTGMSVQGVNVPEDTYITAFDAAENTITVSKDISAVTTGTVLRYKQTNQRGGLWRVNIVDDSKVYNADHTVNYAVNKAVTYSDLHGAKWSDLLKNFGSFEGVTDYRQLVGKNIVLLNDNVDIESWSVTNPALLSDLDATANVDPLLLHLRKQVFTIEMVDTGNLVNERITVDGGKDIIVRYEQIIKLVHNANYNIKPNEIVNISSTDANITLDYNNRYIAAPTDTTDEIVYLDFVQEIEIGTKIKVAKGKSHGFSYLTYDALVDAGNTVPHYAYWEGSIEADSSSETRNYTRFDGGGTRFFNHRDQYTSEPESGDKYLKFPQTGVFK